MSVLAILQGRFSSRRLPGKVLKPLLDRPMILRQIERLDRCATIDGLIVATSVEESDAAIAETCANASVSCLRGPLDDVLARFCQVIDSCKPDHVIRLTADCPLTDWSVVDKLVQLHLDTDADYSTNALQRTFPKGLDCEIVRADVLRRIQDETDSPFDREHVTPYIYRPNTEYSISHLTQDTDLSFLRWTVDLPEDFEFVSAVYEYLYEDNSAFTSDAVLELLQRRPELRFINAAGLSEEEAGQAQRYWQNI